MKNVPSELSSFFGDGELSLFSSRVSPPLSCLSATPSRNVSFMFAVRGHLQLLVVWSSGSAAVAGELARWFDPALVTVIESRVLDWNSWKGMWNLNNMSGNFSLLILIQEMNFREIKMSENPGSLDESSKSPVLKGIQLQAASFQIWAEKHKKEKDKNKSQLALYKIYGPIWEKLSRQEKKPFEDEVQKLYSKKVGVQKPKKARKPSQKLKYPPNSLGLWLEEVRTSDDVGKSVVDLSRKYGEAWRNLTQEERRPLIEKARKLREMFKKEHPLAYTRKKDEEKDIRFKEETVGEVLKKQVFQYKEPEPETEKLNQELSSFFEITKNLGVDFRTDSEPSQNCEIEKSRHPTDTPILEDTENNKKNQSGFQNFSQNPLQNSSVDFKKNSIDLVIEDVLRNMKSGSLDYRDWKKSIHEKEYEKIPEIFEESGNSIDLEISKSLSVENCPVPSKTISTFKSKSKKATKNKKSENSQKVLHILQKMSSEDIKERTIESVIEDVLRNVKSGSLDYEISKTSVYEKDYEKFPEIFEENFVLSNSGESGSPKAKTKKVRKTVKCGNPNDILPFPEVDQLDVQFDIDSIHPTFFGPNGYKWENF
ncbi:unnamed protein product [Caenorhabditis nigoni]